MVLLHLGGSLFGLIFSIPELWNLLIGTIHLFPSSLLKLSDRLLNTLFCHFAFGHTLSQDIQLFSGNFEFFFQRSVDEVAFALLATGLLSNAGWSDCCARPASWWLCVSSRHAGLDLKCELFSRCLDLSLVTTQTRTSLYVVVVLTLVMTIFTDTASIVDQADLLFVVILVRDSSSATS